MAADLGDDESFTDYLTRPLATWRRHTDGPLLVVALGSLPLLLLELKRAELQHADQVFLGVVNAVVLVAFAVDYLVELLLCGNRRRYVRREWTSALIVVSQVAALIPGFAGIGALRAVRAVRALRVVAVVLRLLALGGSSGREGRAVLRRNASRFALSLAAFTWLTAAVAFTLVEEVGDGQRVNSFGDALWWATTTITTVGYGDLYPVTNLGRLVGGFTMLIGISTFAVVTAKVAEFLVKSEQSA